MMTILQRYLPHLLSLSGQLCFSGWHIIGSLALKDGANPIVFALYRELLGCLVMYLIIHYKKETLWIKKEDFTRFLFLGLCSFVNVVGAVFALQYISATRYAIFQPAIPCIATVVSIFLGLDKVTWIKLLGVTIAVAGAVLAEAWNSSSGDDEKNVFAGSIISALQVTAMALLIVFAKPVLAKYPSSVVTLAYYGTGTAFTALLASAWACAGQFQAADFVFHYESLPWIALAYASIMATAYTYNVFSWAGQRLSPSLVTVYCTFQPVGTIVLSYFILDEVVSLSEGLGALTVICGLLVTVYGSRKAGEEEEIIHQTHHYGKLYSDEGAEEVISTILGLDVSNGSAESGGGLYEQLRNSNDYT
eukprot:gene8978-9911_t